MLTVILRSTLVGIALAIGATVFGLLAVPFVVNFVRMDQIAPSDSDIGWGIVTMAHNHPPLPILVLLGVFTIGFLLSYLHFSRSLARKQNTV